VDRKLQKKVESSLERDYNITMATESWDDLAELGAYKPNAVENTNLLIIDGNNLGYRYLKRKNFSSFEDDYVRTVESLAKSYKCKDIVVTYDFGKSEYRKSIFPEYKGNRTIAPEDKDHYEQFFKELNKTSDNLPFQKFKFFGVEADDIISYIVQKVKHKYPAVWIVSSDRDIYQLLDHNVHIFNLFSRKEINLDYLLKEKSITPDEYRLSRIIQGDAGDNIDGIEGIGEKRGQDLAKTYKTLPNLLSKLPLPGKSQYIRNLNAGKDMLLLNEKLINLTTHTREIICFGAKGEEHLQCLEDWARPIINNYPDCITIKEINKPITELADIRGMEGNLKV
jgi:5'-3' exonuclease